VSAWISNRKEQNDKYPASRYRNRLFLLLPLVWSLQFGTKTVGTCWLERWNATDEGDEHPKLMRQKSYNFVFTQKMLYADALKFSVYVSKMFHTAANVSRFLLFFPCKPANRTFQEYVPIPCNFACLGDGYAK
jgi:hypothetical protein